MATSSTTSIGIDQQYRLSVSYNGTDLFAGSHNAHYILPKHFIGEQFTNHSDVSLESILIKSGFPIMLIYSAYPNWDL